MDISDIKAGFHKLIDEIEDGKGIPHQKVVSDIRRKYLHK